MKFLIYSIFIFLSINYLTYSKYWKQIDNLPNDYKNNYWLDVYFLPSNPNYGWVCGFNGQIIRTTDGGATWQGATAPNAYHLESVHFPSISIGYTSGPNGIWKSTDGGATWFDITPNSLLNDFWGCYFLDDNNGVLLGGGCVSNQEFYRTTDGGVTWTNFEGYEPNSGLTDAILYPSGEGFASSSGLIWKTTDSGYNWDIFSIVGNKVWQEEITNYGSSFLVPYAGNDCQGGGDVGGAKFSVDNGLTWRDQNTRVSMFGSFLISPTKGWACGNNKTIIYTSDGGLNWQLKNCGLNNGDYDDIWFVNEDNGWVVGSGVYHLAPSNYPVSKDTIFIDNVCIGQNINDTLWIKNNSFDNSTGKIDILPSNSRYLLNASNYFNMNPCDNYPIIITFKPIKDTTIIFNFDIIINETSLDKTTHTITVILKNTLPTSYPEFSNIVIDSIKVGTDYKYSLKIFSKNNNENLIDYEKIISNPNINISTKLPITAFANGNYLDFNFTPTDTGWITAKYRLKFDKCNFDTIISIQAYAYSPIIQSKLEIKNDISCTNPIQDTIDIYNNGNDDLVIATYTLLPQNNSANIKGFIGEKLPIIIKPNQSKKLIVEVTPNNLGADSLEILLVNNDATTARGIKNPYKIKLSYDYHKPIITTTDVIDFGEICPGKEVSLPITLTNLGNIDGNTIICRKLNKPFDFRFLTNPNSVTIKPNDSISSYITFKSNTSGLYIDTLEFKTSPCDETKKIILKAAVIGSEVEIIPSKIDTLFKAGDTITVIVRISAIERDLIIKNIYLNIPASNWYIKPDIVLPLAILKGKVAVIKIAFSSKDISSISGQLIFENSSICDTIAQIDVNLSTYSKFVTVGPKEIDFGTNLCSIDSAIKEIEIENKGFVDDTISNISIDNSNFEILNLPKLPLPLKVSEKYILQIKYKPSKEGGSNAILKIETVEPFKQDFKVMISGAYYNSQIKANKLELNFGNVEVCQLQKIDSLIFNSTGILDDTLEITSISTNSFVELNNSLQILPIKSKSSAYLKVLLLTDRLEPGYNELKFQLKSRICNLVFDITVKATLVRPRLILNPKPLNYGNVWVDETKTLPLELTNNSNIDITIDTVEINSDEFYYDGPLHLTIVANSFITIPISLRAKYEGEKDCNIKFIFHTNCIDSTFGQLIADVPKEEYKLYLRIGHYIATPDSNLTMAISSDYEINHLETDNIKFYISYDRKLFYPQNIYFNNQLNKELNSKDISFDNSFGKLNIVVKSESAAKLFNHKGDIIYIQGKVLAAVPDYTDIIFDSLFINFQKPIDMNLIDGSLQVIDFCHQTAKFELQFIPNFIAKFNSIIRSNELPLTMSATKNTLITVKIINLSGEEFTLGQFNVEKSEITFNNNISILANGLYFINFQNEYWSKTYKLMIMR